MPDPDRPLLVGVGDGATRSRFAVRFAVLPPCAGTAAHRTVVEVLRAAEESCRDTPIDSVSVHDLCAAAGVSISSFYACFGSKSQFVTYVHALYLVAAEESLRRELVSLEWDARTERLVSELISRYLRVCVRLAALGRALRPAELATPLLYRRRRWVEAQAIAEFVEVATSRRRELVPTRLSAVTRVVTTAMYDACGLRRGLPGLGPDGGRSLVEELAALALAGLAIPSPHENDRLTTPAETRHPEPRRERT